MRHGGIAYLPRVVLGDSLFAIKLRMLILVLPVLFITVLWLCRFYRRP